MNGLSQFALAAFLIVATSCRAPEGVRRGDGIADPHDDSASYDPLPPLVLIVGDAGFLNASEEALAFHLTDGLYRAVILVDDDDLEPAAFDDVALFIMSKTVQSTTVADQLTDTEIGVLFWEDNQQMLSMMASIDNDGSGGTTWHAASQEIHVLPSAPFGLSSGLEGTVEFYTRPDQVTYAPAGDLPASAIRVARFREGDDRFAIYAYERGARLADGTPAAGRRVYFGLYDDTFRILTSEGRALFDAAISWASGARPRRSALAPDD